MLELIVREPKAPARTPPLLFVHGVWHAAWCWDEYFLPCFAAQGYACYALSLRGHGGSSGRERLRRTRVRDYVDDVAQTTARLPAQPVLIGHSMGGFLVQKYLEQHTAAGAVLLASLPPTGALRAALHMLVHYPMPFVRGNVSLSLAPLVASPELARAHFFSASMPQEQVSIYQQRLQDDSYAAFLDLVAFDLVKTKRVNPVPMLVLGAENDTVVAPQQVRRTARAYGTQAEFIPAIAHDMMLDAGWQAVAQRMLSWLDEKFPASSGTAAAPQR